MTWSVKYNSASKIVEVIYAGNVTGKEIQEAVKERVRMQKEHVSLFVLLDCSKVEHMAGGIMDVHTLPAEIYKNTKVERQTYHALVLSQFPQAREASFHYETTCANRGWHVKCFDIYTDAVGWLTEEMTSSK